MQLHARTGWPPPRPHLCRWSWSRRAWGPDSFNGTAKEKATIRGDRARLSEARAPLGVSSRSTAIDVALSELSRRRRGSNDVGAYTDVPPSDEEAGHGRVAPGWGDLADDTDREGEWPEEG